MMSLAWPLFRVTEQAALAAWPQTGCGDKNKIDGLAVTAMRRIKRRRFSWASGYRRGRD
ncbi:hypothetical protein ECZU34_60460 [Escherichia coli]|nr:hypothetical protein ECZU34_60460 [Escherichia coli]